MAETITWACQCQATVDRVRKTWRWIAVCDLHQDERDDLEWALEWIAENRNDLENNLTRPRAAREPPEEKLCPYCGQVLPAVAFFPAPTNVGGLSAGCRDCLARRLRDGARRGHETLRRRRATRATGPRRGDVHGVGGHPGG